MPLAMNILLPLAFLSTTLAYPDLSPFTLLPRAGCTARGETGNCLATASCDGWSVPGECAGPKDIQCCISVPCNDGVKGLCKNNNKPCSSGYLKGKCPGGDDIQCCPDSKPPANDPPAQPSRPAECTDPKPDTCTFYPNCLEPVYRCGPEGYPIGYGLKYCRAFTGAKGALSSRGDKWVTDTMLCLQRALVPFASPAGKLSGGCSALQSRAIATHPDCYVNSGVCTLGPADWTVIVRTVAPKNLFGSLDNLKAVLKTVGGCAEFYLWLIKEGIVKAAEEIADVAEDVWDKVTFWD